MVTLAILNVGVILWFAREIATDLWERERRVRLRRSLTHMFKWTVVSYSTCRAVSAVLVLPCAARGTIISPALEISRSVMYNLGAAFGLAAYIIVCLLWCEMAVKMKHLALTTTFLAEVRRVRIWTFTDLAAFIVIYLTGALGAEIVDAATSFGNSGLTNIFTYVYNTAFALAIFALSPLGLHYTMRFQELTASMPEGSVPPTATRRNAASLVGHTGMLCYVLVVAIALLAVLGADQESYSNGVYVAVYISRYMIYGIAELCLVATFYAATESYGYWRQPWALSPAVGLNNQTLSITFGSSSQRSRTQRFLPSSSAAIATKSEAARAARDDETADLWEDAL